MEKFSHFNENICLFFKHLETESRVLQTLGINFSSLSKEIKVLCLMNRLGPYF